MTALITLTTAGADTGPFDIYSDADAFVTAFETGISKVAITAGYTSTVVPIGTTVVRVMSNNGLCSNYIDITATITTTTTTTIAPTTTTTSTLAPTTTTTTTLAPEVIILAYSGIDGPDACLSYSLEGVTTYYAAPGSVIANDTIIYTDPELTMVAPNGYYSSGTDYYDILTSDGVLANETPCPAITTTTTTTVAATTTTTTTASLLTISSSIPVSGTGTLDFAHGQPGEVITLSFSMGTTDGNFNSLDFAAPAAVAILDPTHLTRTGNITLNGSGIASSVYLFDTTSTSSSCLVTITSRSSGLPIPVINSTNIIN
jgi:hypothetical protein